MGQTTSNPLKQRLTSLQWDVTQNKGTEPAFKNEYYNNKKKGLYNCICCGEQLFKSSYKFDSGSGWPSFYFIEENRIIQETDKSHGMTRIEVKCKQCSAHLGHLFNDGPEPTGLRYCINSAALSFIEQEYK